MLKTVFWISLSLGFTSSCLRPILENVSGLQKCKWILGGDLWWFVSAIKWRGFTIPVTQSTRQMITRKKSCDSSDSSELEYRTILFDNIKTCLHLHTFFWFNRSIESFSIFMSLLAAATRTLKAEFFYWKNICSVSLCACNHLFFDLVFCSQGGFHLEQKWKALCFFSGPNALRISCSELLQKCLLFHKTKARMLSLSPDTELSEWVRVQGCTTDHDL